MSIDPQTPSKSHNFSPSDSTDADRLRDLLHRAGLSQRAAAKLVSVEERTMRQWCAGQGKPPASVFRALNPKLTHNEYLRRLIESNEKTIEAMRDGRVTGMGYGAALGTPQSVALEIDRLRKSNEEYQALIWQDEAFQRQQEAYFRLNEQFLPHGNGLPSAEIMAEVDAAEKDFRVAQAEVDRIMQEIRAGRRR